MCATQYDVMPQWARMLFVLVVQERRSWLNQVIELRNSNRSPRLYQPVHTPHLHREYTQDITACSKTSNMSCMPQTRARLMHRELRIIVWFRALQPDLPSPTAENLHDLRVNTHTE